MARGVVDFEALRGEEMQRLRSHPTPPDIPFRINKIGHVVLRVSDLERSVKFYTEVLGFRISDVYPHSMMPGKMVFMRCNTDHHGVALVGGGKGGKASEMHHMAFEVASLDEVLAARAHLEKHGVKIDFEGRRRAGCQIAVEFRDPDGHFLEIYWGLDQVGTDGRVRPPEEWREAFSLEEAIDNPPLGQNTMLRNPALRRK